MKLFYAFIVFVFSVVCAHSAHENELIKKIHVRNNFVKVEINTQFKKQYLVDDFFAEYDSSVNLEGFDYSILSMPFIMNAISIIWISGETYTVEEMDTELYQSLQRVKKVFQYMYPKTRWDGELKPKKLVSHPGDFSELEKTSKTALLYSGGIDSTSTGFAHLDKKQLLITAWGHWDLPLNESELWKKRKKRTEEFAQKYGNQASFIRSNYTEFLNWQYLSQLSPEISKWRLGAVEGLGWAGLTAPLLLTKKYPILRIASSHTWRYPYPSASSPFIDNNLYFCGLRVLHDQWDMTRLMKVQFISSQCDLKSCEKPYLKICPLKKNHDGNCGACRKCLSSALCFFAIGRNPQHFGLSVSLEAAVKATKELLTPTKLNFYTILLFKEVQEVIAHRIKKGEKIPEQLRALLDINLDKKIAFDTEKQHKLEWNILMSFLPEESRKEIPLPFF
jgi:hypothetical protein